MPCRPSPGLSGCRDLQVRMPASVPGCVVWVAEGDGGSLHGLAAGHVMFSIEDNGPAAQLTALVVDRSVQGTGLGRRLVETFENWAGENAVVRVVTTSATHRAAAQAFYVHLGYEHPGRRFGKRLVDRRNRP